MTTTDTATDTTTDTNTAEPALRCPGSPSSAEGNPVVLSDADDVWARDYWAGDPEHPLLTADDLAAFAAETADLQALARVEHGLSSLPLPEGVSEALMSVIRCATAQGASHDGLLAADDALTDAELVDGTRAAAGVCGFVDAVVVGATRALADRTGRELLHRKKVSSPQELGRVERERWVARTKSAVAQQLAVTTGEGVMAAHARVGFALAPRAAVGVVETALSRGLTDWRRVSDYWQACRRLPFAEAGTVAEAVFGPLVQGKGPEDAAEDDTSRRRETRTEFRRRLDREVRRVEGEDATAARERRRAALAQRDVCADIYDDGVGRLTITGGVTSIVAGMDRIESIARIARKAGDERRLGQIRADTALALLVNGVLPLPTRKADPCGCHREESDCRPVDSTAPSSPVADQPSPATGAGAGDASGGRGQSTDWEAHDSEDSAGGLGSEDSAGVIGSPESHRSCSCDPLVSTPEEVGRIIRGQPAASVELVLPLNALLGAGPGMTPGTRHTPPRPHDTGPGPHDTGPGVAEIPGHGFVTAEHAREIVLRPGSTIHRLVTDPLDGRLVERSTTAYRPDSDMVKQVRAADRFCRAPGCLVPAKRCELDHETPFGAGGRTAEDNLNLKHPRHHQLKTERLWSSAMESTRDVTWTTLFGRVFRTRAHDYRQYAQTPGGAVGSDSDVTASSSRDDGWSDVADGDLRDRLVYAALASRDGMNRWLEGLDDHDTGEWVEGFGQPVSVFHRRGASRRAGPPPGQLSPEEVLRGPGGDSGVTRDDTRPAPTPPRDSLGGSGWARSSVQGWPDQPPF